MKRWRTAAIFGPFAIAASLALACVHPFGDAGLYRMSGGEVGAMRNSSIPPAVRSVLASKCADCHTLQTKAPVYGRFAPVSWMVERDIVRGRKAMNLTQWDSYSRDDQQVLAAKIAERTKREEMPLLQYRLVHWNARVTDDNVRTLMAWARSTSVGQAGADDQPQRSGDAARGKQLFEARCSGCHSLTANSEGPRLQGVYGRTSGTAAGFAYSDAVARAHVVWDESTLDKWLTDPDIFIPGNAMDFLVPKVQDRSDLISYLQQTSGK